MLEEPSNVEMLMAENAGLRARLDEAEEALRAIRSGEVDALVVDGETGPRLFTLQGIDAVSNRFRGEMLAQVREAVIVTDDEHRVTYFNTAAELQYGVTASDVLGCKLHTVYEQRWIHPDDEAAMNQVFDTESYWCGEVIHVKRNGDAIFVEGSVTMLDKEKGPNVGRLSVIRDITTRKRAEEELRAAHTRLQNVLASITDGLAVLDKEWRYTYVSEPGARIIGLRPEELLGGCVWELFPEALGTRFEEGYRRAVATGKPVEVEEFYPEPLNKWLECHCYPSGDGLSVYFHDITTRKQAEAALRQNAELFSLLIEQAPTGVYVVDGQFLLRQINALAQPAFQHVNPLIGRDFSEIMHILWGPEVGAECVAIFRHTLETGERYISPPFSHQRQDLGVEKAFEWETHRVLLPDGQHGVVCYFNDVTERNALHASLREQAEQLAHADRRKDEFLAMLAHELRNPLAPLRNAMEILNTTGASAANGIQARSIIKRQIDNMTRMIDDLLDVSRITEGKIELRKQAVELQPILAAVAQVAGPEIAANSQKLELHLPAEPIFLDADPTRIEQIFGNLLGNACKYSGTGARISISARITPDYQVVIRVSDDGIGISPELVPVIFDLFVQSSRTLDRAHGGLGIGLTVVDRMVKLHGGHIEARSEGLGKGTEFTIHLPLLAKPTPMPLAVADRPAADATLRLLIVDDNQDAAQTMAMLQRLRGHQTRVANNGPDALAVAAEFLPQAVLLDIGLPDMDGFEVARRLRMMPEMENAFLIALTGYAAASDRQRSGSAGFDEHLAKPADLNVLRDLLQECARSAGELEKASGIH